MPSDSVTSFLDRARASRLLPPDQVDDLIRRPDVPQEDLAAVCGFLQARGVLTGYQADLILAGRTDELTFAGYPVVGELGPCPGGTAYRALHPSLRTPVILRRLRPDVAGPAGDVAAFVRRAQEASTVVHPHLAQLLDAGVHHDEPFVTLEPFDGADLQALVTDIGPMPAALAAAYARQAALALQTAHDRGLAHGGVRPVAIHVGPLVPMATARPDGTPRLRPSSNATVKLFELGLVPRSREGGPAGYLPPEAHGETEPTLAGDVYGLGATVYFLLTGREPFAAPLGALRPDLPAEWVALVGEMTASDPSARPTAAAVADRLAGFVGPPTPAPARSEPPSAGSSVVSAAGRNGDGHHGEAADGAGGPAADAPPPESPAGEWVAVPYQGPADPAAPTYTPTAFGEWPPADDPEGMPDLAADAAPLPERPRGRSRAWVWVAVGAGLQLLAILGWVYMFAQPGCSRGSGQEDAPRKANRTK